MDEIRRLDVRIGDWVRGRAWRRCDSKSCGGHDKDHPRGDKEVEDPEKCPVCGNKVVRTEGEVDYRCVNANCPAKLLGTILHFASRGVMNIDGMGDALVTQLTERGLVKNVADIYKLTKDDLLSLERFARQVGTKYSQRNREFEEAASGARDLRAWHSHGRRAHRAIPRRALRLDGGSGAGWGRRIAERRRSRSPHRREHRGILQHPGESQTGRAPGRGRSCIQRQEKRTRDKTRRENIRPDRHAGQVTRGTTRRR